MHRRCRVPKCGGAGGVDVENTDVAAFASAKRTAVARPIPLAPPVSRTWRPESPLIDDPLGGSSATIGGWEIGSTAGSQWGPMCSRGFENLACLFLGFL